MNRDTDQPTDSTDFAHPSQIDWFGDGFGSYLGLSGPFEPSEPSEHLDRGEHPRELADVHSLADLDTTESVEWHALVITLVRRGVALRQAMADADAYINGGRDRTAPRRPERAGSAAGSSPGVVLRGPWTRPNTTPPAAPATVPPAIEPERPPCPVLPLRRRGSR